MSGKVKSSNGALFEAIYPGASQKRTTGVASAQSAAFDKKTSIVMLYATEDCHVKFGSNPTAVANGSCMFIPQNTLVMVGVIGGQKLAAIQDTAAGILYVTEGA